MLGHWVREDGAGSETWTAAGPALLGIGFASTSTGTSWFEALTITDVNGALTYTAIPGGQQAVDFPLVETGAESVLFANPAHDHPQRIRYHRRGEMLSAEIESTGRGVERWAWQRAKLVPAVVLEEEDRRFAADSAAHGADAWAAAFAPDGLMWRRGHPPIVGPGAIRESMQRAFSDLEHLLAWEPHTSALSPAGDMGFTIGCYQPLRQKPAAPSAQEGTGTYLTIWRRQADGSWRAVFDTEIANTLP
jgi:ketosteroid isomerase-like protein